MIQYAWTNNTIFQRLIQTDDADVIVTIDQYNYPPLICNNISARFKIRAKFNINLSSFDHITGDQA